MCFIGRWSTDHLSLQIYGLLNISRKNSRTETRTSFQVTYRWEIIVPLKNHDRYVEYKLSYFVINRLKFIQKGTHLCDDIWFFCENWNNVMALGWWTHCFFAQKSSYCGVEWSQKKCSRWIALLFVPIILYKMPKNFILWG